MSNTEGPDTANADLDWFSVRCVFRHGSDAALTTYEERITLWRAASFEEAILLAEAEAREHAQILSYHYLGFAQAYRLFDEVGHGAEVYSLIRDSQLAPDEYLATHFDTGLEYQGDVEEQAATSSVQQPSTATAHAASDVNDLHHQG